MGITEHIEGDECKFSVWTGRAPAIENKAIMKVTYIIVSTAPVIYTRFESADVCLQIGQASADVLSQNPSM